MHFAKIIHFRTNIKHPHRNIEAKLFHWNQFLIVHLILRVILLKVVNIVHLDTEFSFTTQSHYTYRKVASSRLSRLVAHSRIFRRLMKGKFEAYVLWPLAKKFQNWIVDQSTARDFTVIVSQPGDGQIMGTTLKIASWNFRSSYGP